MSDKIQVGENVWIKPNRGQSLPTNGDTVFCINSNGHPRPYPWNENDAPMWSMLRDGNVFSTYEAAEAAIIKPVDHTPITYEQWVEAGKPNLWTIGPVSGDVYAVIVSPDVKAIHFVVNKRWLTAEAAQAWLDKWNAEHGVKE